MDYFYFWTYTDSLELDKSGDRIGRCLQASSNNESENKQKREAEKTNISNIKLNT